MEYLSNSPVQTITIDITDELAKLFALKVFYSILFAYKNSERSLETFMNC